jgi:hypothetical protein
MTDMNMIHIVERAAQAVPAYRTAQAAPLVRTIARRARQRLGRRASRSRRWLDWQAVEAVEDIAVELGLPPVARWASPGMSLAELAQALVYRAYESGLGVDPRPGVGR